MSIKKIGLTLLIALGGTHFSYTMDQMVQPAVKALVTEIKNNLDPEAMGQFLKAIGKTAVEDITAEDMANGAGKIGRALTESLGEGGAEGLKKIADSFHLLGQKGGESFGAFVKSIDEYGGPALKKLSETLFKQSGESSGQFLDVASKTSEGMTGIGTKVINTFNKEMQQVGKEWQGLTDQGLKMLIKNAALGLAVTGGITFTYFVAQKAMEKYITRYLFEPALIEKKTGGISNWVSSLFGTPVVLKERMVLDKKCEDELNYIINMTKNIRANGGDYENILLWGFPGTGKTLFANLLAESSGMDYAFVPGANVNQFLKAGTAVQELNNLFDWASKSSKGVILFFDECETFLADRSMLDITGQAALGAFLGRTGTPSNKFMVICATNRPEILDPAVKSRLGLSVEVPLPGLVEREKQLEMHIKFIFGNQKKGKVINYDYLKNPDIVHGIAVRLERASGRTIQKFVNRLRQFCLAQDTLTVDQKTIDKILVQIERQDLAPKSTQEENKSRAINQENVTPLPVK